MSFFFEPFDALESEFQFVLLDPCFDVVLSVAQHAVDQSCQMVGHGHDCFWGAKSSSQASVLGSQGAFTVGQTLSAKPQGLIPIAVQAFGNRLVRGFDAGAAQGCQLLWITFS